MKIGLYLMTQWPQGAPLDAAVDDLAAQVRAARDNGLVSIWAAQHFLTEPLQMIQMTPILARLAADGEGLTFGTGIALVSMLNPVAFAEDMASLDWITGGNLVVGTGMGYRREEFDALGVPFDARVERYEEAIPLLRRLWTEPRVRHDGRHFKIHDLGLGIQPKAPPPIWMGGEAKPAVTRAARLGDAWLPAPATTLAKLAELMPVYRAARAEIGQPMPATQPLIRECVIGDTRDAALAAARPSLLGKYQAYAAWGQKDSAASGLSDKFDDFMDDRFIVGDASAVTDEIMRYNEAIGVDQMILRVQWPGLGQAAALDAIKRLGGVIARLP